MVRCLGVEEAVWYLGVFLFLAVLSCRYFWKDVFPSCRSVFPSSSLVLAASLFWCLILSRELMVESCFSSKYFV